MPDCVGVLKYGLYSVRLALPESRSFQMVLEAPRCFQMFLDVSKCVQKFLEPESHRGPTLKHRPQHRAEDTESLERLRQQISISVCLMGAFRQRGWLGTIPNELKAQARDLGVTDPTKLMKDIHVNSVNYLAHIVRKRRELEAQLANASNPHRPP
eukprot:jgi/Chrzof1/5488/Cz16g05050.t1